MPRVPALLAPAILAALLLAGCASPAASPEGQVPASDEGRTGRFGPGDVVGSIESDLCIGDSYVAFVPTSAVAPELPDGFAAADLGGANNPHLAVFTCETVTMPGVDGNVTEANVTFALSGTLLEEGGHYRWEIFVDESEPHAVAGFLRGLGWPVLDAAIERSPDGVDIAAEGVHYAVSILAVRRASHSYFDDWQRVHHATPDGVHLQMDENLHTGTQVAYASILEADGGVWSRIEGRVGASGVPGTVGDLWSVLQLDAYAPGDGPEEA